VETSQAARRAQTEGAAASSSPSRTERVIAFAGEGLVELTLDGERASLACGGDAANAAAMCARLGGPTRLLGRVGADPLGRRLLSFWRSCGIDVSAVVVDEHAPTGVYVNELPCGQDDSQRPFIYWRRGSAGSRWSPSDVEKPGVWSGIAAVVVTGITLTLSGSCATAVWTLIERAPSHSIPVACILNYRSALRPDVDELARLALSADVLIGSVEDLRSAFPNWSPVEVFDVMKKPDHELVVTGGAVGASVHWSGGGIRQRAPSVSVRDTVGAGDALAGAYLAARFQRGEPPAEALAWGVAAASLSVQQHGCASSYPDAAATAAARADLPAATPWTSVASGGRPVSLVQRRMGPDR